jgi:RNA polymerase sigma factor (sigma-70 family)
VGDLEPLLRDLAPQVVAAVVRRYGDFDAGEDAVQEALLAAATQWPVNGVPDDPRAWLITVASRARIAAWRKDSARERRERTATRLDAPAAAPAPAADDTLTLLLLCGHPALTPASQVALTLRAVGGLTTAEIARALLVPEATLAQRISRAKQTIRAAGARFTMPPPEELPARLAAVLHVLYLIFNEGYTASSGDRLHRVELTAEAIRLARQLHGRLPGDGEVAGLLALMLLTDARRPARTRPDGALVPLAEQDRGRWDRTAIAEGVDLVSAALTRTAVGPYQLQAAIAAVHDEARSAADTDWPQILGLYDALDRIAPGPMVTLNRVVALAMVRGPRQGLAALAAAEPALAGHHRVAAVRAHLLETAGEAAEAKAAYEQAARQTLSEPERAYLTARAAQIST